MNVTPNLDALLDEKIREIFLDVIESKHGDFLKAFALALRRADPENFQILRGPALQLIAKYELFRPMSGNE